MGTNLFTEVRARIERDMAESAVPAVAVGVAQHGRVLWAEGFGWADRDNHRPADAHTLFSQASVTKPMTATALMRLVERGDIDLDRPINDYLDANCRVNVHVGDAAQVTVRRIANHTAGLPKHGHIFRPDDATAPISSEEAIRRYGHVITPAGEQYRYSNIGYLVLEHLIERVSGTSYAEFMRHEVFLPLGMTRSSVHIALALSEHAAERYDDEGQPIPFYDMDHRGASAVYSSAHDMLRFGMFHLKQRLPDQEAILRDETIDAMQVPGAPMNERVTCGPGPIEGPAYGIGWAVDASAPTPWVRHTGSMGGARTKLLLLPREGVVVAAAANRMCALPHEIDRDILAALLPQRAAQLAAHDDATTAARVAPAHEPNALAALHGDWRGHVHTPRGAVPMTLSITPDGEMRAQLGEQPAVRIDDVSCAQRRLHGRMSSTLNTDDARRRPHDPRHHLILDLRHRDEVINGALVTVCGNSLSHWVELART